MTSRFSALTIGALALFAATNARAESISLSSSEACEDIREQLIEWAAYQAVMNRYYASYWHRYDRSYAGSAVEPAPAQLETKTGDVATAAGPTNYTTTNVQERGVDEADVIKTDGKHIYTVHGRQLLILKSWPIEQTTIVGKLELPANATPTQLFLRGDKLVILSTVQEQVSQDPTRSWFYGTRVSIVDIRDRERPIFDRHLDIEGWTNQSRMVGDDLYLVSNSSVMIPQSLSNLANELVAKQSKRIERGDWQHAQRILANHLRDRYPQIDLDEAMPRTRRSFFRGPMSSLRSMYSCEEIYVPSIAGAQLGILNLTHLDLKRSWEADHTGVFANGWNVYASTEALYVTMPHYGWGWAWGWWNVQYDSEEHNRTHVHKFALRGDDGRPSYAGSGTVRGYVNNQFSLSEHRGDLRIVTTDIDQSGNHLFVMRERRGHLESIGSITNLAPGERIYSARMFGEKGYMVTFRQTDPLFTLDLSNPEQPRVAGELKINGFSSYIHPLDSDHLLTIGQDADDNGRVRGVHIQIFDVSDPARPARSHHHRLTFEGGWSWSAAQWDHRAFTFDPVSKTLALPVQIWGNSNASANFNGLVLFHVDARRGFEELGRITHEKLAVRAGYDQNGWAYGYGGISRSIIMDEYVFTLSNLGLQANVVREPTAERVAVLFAGTM
jgi:uncharacterized secreted protein with C-terminal beta-propeller domain